MCPWAQSLVNFESSPERRRSEQFWFVILNQPASDFYTWLHFSPYGIRMNTSLYSTNSIWRALWWCWNFISRQTYFYFFPSIIHHSFSLRALRSGKGSIKESEISSPFHSTKKENGSNMMGGLSKGLVRRSWIFFPNQLPSCSAIYDKRSLTCYIIL